MGCPGATEGVANWLMWILINEQNDSSHMAFAATFWLTWNFACVKPNQLKGQMQMSRHSSTASDHITQTTGMKTPFIYIHLWPTLTIRNIHHLTSAPGRLVSRVAPAPGLGPPGPPAHWVCSSCTDQSSTAHTDPFLGSPVLGTTSNHQAWMQDSQKTPAENTQICVMN